jgi:hypothetical protein
VSGGTLVWLTDNELALLLDWYGAMADRDYNGHEDDTLRQKLEAVREEIACRVPRGQ